MGEIRWHETAEKCQIVLYQRWKPVGSRFFDWPVKPVETAVKLSFFATKRHLSTNQTFIKKNSILTNDTL